MKVKSTYILKELGGEYVILPVGQDSINLGGVLKVNEVSAFLFKQLNRDISLEELCSALCNEYEVSREQAMSDILVYIDQLKKYGAI